MTFWHLGFIGSAAIALAACNHPTPPSGFLGADDARLRANKNLPFQRSWINPKADFSHYRIVAIVPMLTNRLKRLEPGLDAANVRNIGDMHRDDSKDLAAYATSEFLNAVRNSRTKSAFVIPWRPRTKGLLVVESSLIEAVPGHPSAQIVNFIFPFTSLLNQPSVSIEVRVLDAASGETLLAFADREKPSFALFDTRKFTYYATQEREIDRWARQLTTILEGNGRQPHADPFIFQPIDW